MNDKAWIERQTMQPFLKCCESVVYYKFEVMLFQNSFEVVQNDESDIENGTVFVSENSIIDLGAKENDWAHIWVNESHMRSAKLFVHKNVSDGVVCLSPQLWFNINSISSKYSPSQMSEKELMISKCSNIPLFTKAVHVSLVQSPHYIASCDYSLLLRSYFSKQKVLQKGDVFAVDSKLDLSYFMKMKQESNDLWPLIYFKVVQIEGDGCLIDVNNSKLYQIGTTRSFVPSMLTTVCNDSDLRLGFLEKEVENLKAIIFPYLCLLENVAVILLSGVCGSGKSYISRSACKLLNLHCYEVDCNRILCDTASATETKMKIMFDKVSRYCPCVVLISNLEVLCTESSGVDARISECFQHNVNQCRNDFPAVFIVKSSDPELILKSEYGTVLRHHLKIKPLDEKDRISALRRLLKKRLLSDDIDLHHLAKRLSGFVLDDLQVVVKKAISVAYHRITQTDSGRDCLLHAAKGEVHIVADDFDTAVKQIEKSHMQVIGAPSVPNIDWADIGGLENIKKEILETIRLPLDYSQLSETGLRRSGLLLYGPPGTGKTLLAKAVASQCGLNFLSVKGPEIINMYVGQSERNVRNIFETARSVAPCVVFFDEIDSIAPNRGRSGDSGGVMDRVVSQLLSEIDGVHKNNRVFVIGATNRPDLLDSALLRPGRFDRLLFVGIAEDVESRVKILAALTRNFTFEDKFDLNVLEMQCPPRLTGADFYNICSSAMTAAIQRCVVEIQNEQMLEEQCEIRVQHNDFIEALRTLKPKLAESD